MAAGQQKKRLISSSLHEHYRGKKKKRLDTSDHVLNLRSQIYLEWDDNQKKAVAKREQIGITWKDMAPFVDLVPLCRSGLADVLCVPREIYSLNNLMEVLSYEVWAMCLSESERKLLTQFLPSGTGEQAIQSLLSGENLHFVNPFIRWSSFLCFGMLHPDDVLQREQQTKSIEKGYYSELNKYHTNMLEALKKLKDQWSRCNNPEKLWRFRRIGTRMALIWGRGNRFAVRRGWGELGNTGLNHKSLGHWQDLIKPKERSLTISSKRAKEVPQKVFIRHGDIAKYMSYIKVSRKQHDAIKNLKCSGDGILSMSLSHILGDINAFHVHPYEALEGEENLRLHKRWLLVVNRDLPVAFEARKEMKLQREQLKICLEHELAEKRTLILDKTETNHPEISPQEKIEGGESEHSPTDVFVQEDVSVSVNPEHRHHMGCIPSINSRPELVPVALDKDTVGQVIPILGDNSPVISQFNGNANIVEGLMGAKAKEIWHTVDGPQYNSSSDFSLLKPEPIEEHQAPIIDLERDHDVGESDDASLFSLYASQRINDHLTSFAKGSETLSPYAHHVHTNHLKQPDLQFLMANGSLLETVQFPHQFQHQQNILAHSHARENKSIFSNGIYPNQELYSSANGDLVERAQSNYWPGVEPSTSNSDGSLFSVLSGCRTMQPHSLNTTANSEYLIEARNFGTNNDDVYGHVPHQFKSSNSHEAAVSSTGLHVPWMNYHPQQNSNMQDSIGKPFLRSWNQ